MNFRTLISLDDVTIGYNGHPLLSHINMIISQGDYIGLIGPNGAGKSTLLKTILNILPPIKGRVSRQADLKIGYVPQRTVIDPVFPLSVLETVRAGDLGKQQKGSKWKGFKAAPAKAAINALEKLNVGHLARKSLRDLSGGQQQRVLIARALVRKPKLLILDEPTAGMDIPSERTLLDFIDTLNQNESLTVILVAHQIGLVAGHATKIAIVNKEQSLFTMGKSQELLQDAELSKLYEHPMKITTEADGYPIVRALKSERWDQ